MKAIYTIQNFAKRLVMVLAVGLMAVNAWGTTYTYDLHSVAAAAGGSNVTYWYSDNTCQTHLRTRSSGNYDISTSTDLVTVYYKDATLSSTAFSVAASSTSNYVGFMAASPTALVMGNNGAIMNLPTYSGEKITNVTITTGSGCSTNVTFSVYSGTNRADGTNADKTGAASNSYSFDIDDDYQEDALKIKVTNAYNLQIATLAITTAPAGYAVTYNNGGHGTAPSNTTATAVTLAAITGVTGYTCTGWKANVAVTNTSTSATIAANTLIANGTNVTLSGATTFTAQWSANTTTVSFNQNGGTGGQTTSKTATYDAAMPTPITCPTREHYDFGGYYDGAGGTGTQYYTNTGASARSWNKDAASATLYAKWTEHSLTNYRTLCSTVYDITLTGDGEATGGLFSVTDGDSDVDKAAEGDLLELEAVADDGYEFSNWEITYTDSGDDAWDDVEDTGEATEDDIIIVMPAADITVNAVFSCIEPTISAQSSDANYFVDDSPTALSVTASAGTGSLGYLWKVSTNGGSTWSDASGTNNTASYSGASLSTASAATLKFKCVVTNTSASCSTESDVVTIVVREASCSGFSFHYGNAGDDASLWTIACFGDAVSNVRTIEDFQIPSSTHFYVGYQGVYTDGNSSSTTAPNSSTLTWSSLYFDASIGDGSRPMVGQATGATGTVKIIDNSDWTNKKASFIPDGYKLKFGSSTYSDFAVYSGHEYRSGLVEYSSSNTDDGVSVGIINANNNNSYVSTDNSVAMRHIFLNTGGTDYWSHDNATNFAIYDDTEGHKYFTCLMVKVPGEDYLYEGWVPTSCTDIIFCRMASSTLEWGADNANVWNYVVSQELPDGKNVFTISAWSTGSWSAYAQKGQFRINEDRTDKNWYVRFVPSYVLSYDANGGEGAPDAQYVSVDADPCQITVTTSEPTRTGYTFLGWNESSSAASKDDDWDGGDTHDMDGDVTLYAVWSANTISLTLDKNNSDASGSSNGSGSIKYDATTKTSITAATRTGYNVEGYYSENTCTAANKVLTASGDVVNSTVSGYTTSGKWTRTTTPTTLYTKWTAKTTTVSFNQNSGTGGQTTTKTATYASAMPTPITLPTREGHTFGGYYESAGGTGAQYYTNAGASAKNWDKEDATWTLYAKWTVNNYTLAWSWDGGSTSSTTHTAAGSVAYGTALVYPANNTMSKTGYSFNGWSSTPSTMPAANTTITAQWSVNNYNVAVLANSNVTITATPSGSSAIAESGNANVNYGTTVTLNCSSITSGMNWGGWKVYKADDASTTVTVSGTGNGATFTMPAYAVKVEAFIYSAGIAWCDPEIEVTGDVHLTSYKDLSVYATSGAGNQISISSSDFGSATRLDVAYLDADDADAEVDPAESVFLFCSSSDYSTIDGLDLDYEWKSTHSVSYTPSAFNQRDNYKLQFTLKRGDKVLKTVTHAIYGRALPEEFVIASKNTDGQWYALPNTLAGTSDAQSAITPIKITVNNTTTPTAASYAPTTTVYKGAARYTATSNINGIKFTNDGSHWLQTGAGSKLWLSATGNSTVQDNVQAWYLKSSDFGAYELAMDPSHSPTTKLGMYSGYMGMYADPADNSEDIYLLPITNKLTPRDATVTEWGQHSVILAVSASDASGAKAHVENGTPTSKQTITPINETAAKAKNFKVPVGSIDLADLANNEGKMLYIDWLNGSDEVIATSCVTIPRIIAEDGTMSEIESRKTYWQDKDVYVLPSATLTADAATFSGVTIKELHIYPGATLKVSTGTLTATTLRLHNGWTRAGEKQYNTARVYIADDAALVKTTASMDYDIYEQSDGKHYYPLAVPFQTAVSSIDYADSYLAGFSNYGANGQYVIKEYDGANRAANGEDSENNWDVVSESGNLVPGKGYIMTAVAVKGEAILRVPLTFDNGWTSDGEKDTYSDVTKNVIAVTAHTGAAATSNQRHAGWNLLGVPYMSCFASKDNMDHEEDDAFITGKMVITGDPADPYGGYDDGVVYVTVPTHDFSEYLQYAIDEGDTKLLPSWCFFVQFAKSGTLTFDAAGEATSGLPIYAPQQREDIAPMVKTGIILSSADASDKTTFIISDRYSASTYEVNADLEKMFGSGYTLATYSLSGSTRLAYNAMSKSDATAAIPIGYRAPTEGEYTFSLNPTYADAPFERVDLIDYLTGSLTNLKTASYTFTTERTQNDGRFAINVVMATDVTTDIANGVNGENGANSVQKVIINDHMYIIRGGQMYDATGKKVKEINK